MCDVGRVAVNYFLNCEVLVHLYLLFCYNLPTVLIVRVGMLNSTNFISSLNTTVTVCSSDRDFL